MTKFEQLVHRIMEDEWESPFPEERAIKYAATLLKAARKQIAEEPKSYDLVKFADWQSIECRNQREKSGIKDPVMLDEIENAAYGGIMNGAEWQKEQMLKDAVERVVKVDAGGYPYIDATIELYDYVKDEPLAKAGDKVKILMIKEE